MKNFNIIVLFILIISTISGCYRNVQVSESQVGLIMPEGNKVDKVVGPGKYSDGWTRFADIEVIDVSSKTFEWVNNDLVTNDKQIIGINIVLTVQRSRNEADVRLMWSQYNTEAVNDEALQSLVFNRLARVAKNATAQFSLDEMLGTKEIDNRDSNLDTTDAGRNYLAAYMQNDLSESLQKAGILLIDLGVSDINPSASYRESLEKKAKAEIDTAVIKQETLRTKERLEQEKANTEIELEKARRERLVSEEQAKVLQNSGEIYELEKLKIMMGSLKNTDKIYFVPEGADISLFMNGGVPVINTQGE